MSTIDRVNLSSNKPLEARGLAVRGDVPWAVAAFKFTENFASIAHLHRRASARHAGTKRQTRSCLVPSLTPWTLPLAIAHSMFAMQDNTHSMALTTSHAEQKSQITVASCRLKCQLLGMLSSWAVLQAISVDVPEPVAPGTASMNGGARFLLDCEFLLDESLLV